MLAANYIRGGYDLVVFESCFEKRRHVQRFLGAYAAPAPVFLFTLWAPLAVVERRERDVSTGRGSALASPRAIWPWSSGSTSWARSSTFRVAIGRRADRPALRAGGVSATTGLVR